MQFEFLVLSIHFNRIRPQVRSAMVIMLCESSASRCASSTCTASFDIFSLELRMTVGAFLQAGADGTPGEAAEQAARGCNHNSGRLHLDLIHPHWSHARNIMIDLIEQPAMAAWSQTHSRGCVADFNCTPDTGPCKDLQAARQYHREAASSRRSAQAIKAALRARSDADHAAAAAEVSDLQVMPRQQHTSLLSQIASFALNNQICLLHTPQCRKPAKVAPVGASKPGDGRAAADVAEA